MKPQMNPLIISIKELDLKQYVDYDQTFSVAKEGSQVDLSQRYGDHLLELLRQDNKLPMHMTHFIELVSVALQSNGVRMSLNFLKKILYFRYTNNQDIEICTLNSLTVIRFKEE